jgi:transcriptional regulator with PAS, ATPase and Fis domain
MKVIELSPILQHGPERDVSEPAPVPPRRRAAVAVHAVASPMQELHEMVARVAPSMISVLILGETGVGKEVLAERLHRASARAGRPFLKLNCAALTESLLESELFGHERGSFTGATSAKQGLLETADGGTVFLDEIGELPLALQAKLLRVIEERAVLPVGALKQRAIDVRFAAATNRDLEDEIERGAFRRDLYFRLNGISLAIPPLRERIDEIGPIARSFIASTWQKLERRGEPEPRLTGEALALLEAYAWPGNIRELRNVIERGTLLSERGVIDVEQLPAAHMRGWAMLHQRAPAGSLEVAGMHRERLPNALQRVAAVAEKQRILDALARCAGNQTQAARLLGVSRATLVNRLDRYAIERPRKPRS